MLKINSETNGEVDITIDLNENSEEESADFNRATQQEGWIK